MIPYIEMTKTNKIPRNILVLIIAKTSNPFEIFLAKIRVKVSVIPANTIRFSKENTPVPVVITKNQKDSPAVTANDLNLGDDVCILYRIDKCD